MSMTITNNVRAVNTTRQLNNNNRNLTKSLERLSSGYRINVGADGPADLVISEQLRAQINGLERAVKNTQEAQNVIGIAEGALNEMNNILRSMRSLALHAANSGVTSPMQVAADQAEVDSSIQTIDRIATTTKFSDQFLLNGNKALTFQRETLVDKTTDHALLDIGMSRFDQVFRTKGYSVNITFSGTTDTAETTGDRTKMAQKGYFEASKGTSGTQIGTTALLTDMRFELTGNKGSRLFSFANGTHLGEMAKSINDIADSTGVQASLVFDHNVAATALTGNSGAGATHAGGANYAGQVGRAANAQEMYTASQNGDAIATATGGATFSAFTGAVVGQNTDADGRVWVKWTTDPDNASNTIGIVYKDSEMTMEVGRYASASPTAAAGADQVRVFSATNNSGLAGGGFTAADVSHRVTVANNVSTIDIAGALAMDNTAVNVGTNMNGLGTNSGTARFTASTSLISGVRLGHNTDDTGNLYFKVVAGANANETKIEVYKDANMVDGTKVAESASFFRDGVAQIKTVRFLQTKMGNDGPMSGIFGAITVAANTDNQFVVGQTGSLNFQNLGLRVSSTEYGSDQYVRVQQLEGDLFTDTTTNKLISGGGTGQTQTSYGSNAQLSINGNNLDMQGTEALVATQDLNAKLVFNQGVLGKTTIAVAGYNDGAIASRAGQMGRSTASGHEADKNHATHAIKTTGERLNQFQGGMQFQLGEGAGGQERTTYGIQSMTVSNLGRINYYGDFGTGTNVQMETRLIAMQDMLGGGLASLATDPIKALHIIDQAIQDVSDLRSRLGAFQANMLQTNANNLGVTIENIVKTESGIRDSDMAYETTQFTKNQIMTSAATAMLAQANAAQQQVLQLLG